MTDFNTLLELFEFWNSLNLGIDIAAEAAQGVWLLEEAKKTLLCCI
jgi:hypothetical protein